MNPILNLLLVLGVLATPVISVTSTFNPDLICTLVVDGTKMNDPRYCDQWIQCIDGKPVSGTCDAGLFYDRESENCVSSSDITCISSDPCAAQANGFAADPYSCNGYYYCKNGAGTHGVCNTGLNYNPGTASCIRDFPCTSMSDPDSICNILPDGVFIKNNTNCNGYEMCWKGAVLSRNCPATFYYSASTAECELPQNVECAFTEPPPQTAQPDFCPDAGIFVSDQSTCNGYYYCNDNSDGQMIIEHGVCSDGRFFYDTNGGACVPRTSIQCNYNRCVNLGYANIELANESDDGCRGYAICQNGMRIGESTCPDDQYFDEVTQRCTTQVISYAACALSDSSTTTAKMDDDATTLKAD